MRGRSQFVGTAGQYFVAYQLSIRGYHSSITMGNAPDVDILVSTGDGARLLALQVKTSRNAHRSNRYGHRLREWDVGANAPNHHRENLWYVFVDLREKSQSGPWDPLVSLVPSLWVGTLVKANWSRKMFMLRTELWPECDERWDKISSFLAGEEMTRQWATTVPENLELS